MTTHPDSKSGDRRTSVVEEYRKLAESYDRRWSFYIEATLGETLKRISLPANARVLDLGCGTGVLLAALSRLYPGASLVGVDPVPEMLSVARRRLGSDITLCTAWAEDLPFGNDQFDVVLCCNAFHYVTEPELALREMRRVLASTGELVITDWCDDYVTCRMCNWYLNLANRTHSAAYTTAECGTLLAQTGWRGIEIERYKINWLWGLMTAKAC